MLLGGRLSLEELRVYHPTQQAHSHDSFPRKWQYKLSVTQGDTEGREAMKDRRKGKYGRLTHVPLYFFDLL